MDPIFSHAGPPERRGEDSAPPPPITATVTVPVEADQAYEGFTEYIHLWWPVKRFSRFGPGTHVSFEGDLLGEEGEDGRSAEWGRVRDAEPSRRLELDFSLGMESEAPSRVVVEFRQVAPSRTDVAVVHDGWAPGDAGRRQRDTYTEWPAVLGFYARFMGAKTSV